MKTLFLTGAGTEIGKTYVGALIARTLREEGHRVGVYKPVASDCPAGRSADAEQLWQAAGRPLDLDAVCPRRYRAPVAPHVSARMQGDSYQPQDLIAGLEPWRNACDLLLVEGAGGLMSPLAEGDFYNADLAERIAAPMLVVTPNRLGVIHDTLATLLAAQQRCTRSKVVGVVLNAVCQEADASVSTNAEEIAARTPTPLVAATSWQGGFDRVVDWAALFA